MISKGRGSYEQSPTQEQPSTRQEKKLMQAIRISEAQGESTVKSGKRRASSKLQDQGFKSRKLLKVDNLPSEDSRKELTEEIQTSSKEVVEQFVPTPQHNQKNLPKAYNPNYEIPDGEEGFFSYLLSYTYSQKEQLFEKNESQWTQLQNLTGTPLSIIDAPKAEEAFQSIQEKLQQEKEKLEILSKRYNDFLKKFLDPEVLFK